MGWGLEKENFCTVISITVCNGGSIFPHYFLFHTTFRIDAFRVSSMISPIPSLLDSQPLSLKTSMLLWPNPPPYNFHTLNEIKDLCNMQTDRQTDGRTEIACTLIIIIQGGYNAILCTGSAHSVSFLLLF